MRDRGYGAAGDIDAVDIPLVEMPGDDGVARTVIRVLADPAWAQDTTVANFEQPSFEMVCHDDLRYSLCVERRSYYYSGVGRWYAGSPPAAT